MNKIKVGIAGAGFVGSTCYQVFKDLENYEVCVFDNNKQNSKLFKEFPSSNFVSFDKLTECDVVFVCVPTPMVSSTGECDTSIVESCVAQLRNKNKNNSIVIKSTVVPGTTKRLNFSYGNVFFNPEFLTEANALEDFKNLEYQIIGINEENVETFNEDSPLLLVYKDCYNQKLLKSDELFVMDSTSAEAVKYVRNCYLATRLSFFNEIKQTCDALGINYEKVAHYAGLDPRVGQHYNIVNADNPGFGGKCLVKDINGFKYLEDKLGVRSLVISAVNQKNLEVRKLKDWEEIPGAVTNR